MATGATEFIDNTTADAFINEVWSQEAIVAREAELLMAGLVNRVFEKDVVNFGDTIHVPSVGNLTVQTKSANTAISYETVTESNTDITIGTHKYNAIAIESITKRQVNRDLLRTYAPKQGYALALDIDDTLCGLIDDFTNAVGTLAVEFTYEDFLRAIQYLDDADVPQGDRVLVISPAQKAGVAKLDSFVHGDYGKVNSGANAAVKGSAMGSWLGIPVHWSSNIEGSNGAGHDNGLFHKEALALVVQMKPTTHTFFDIDYFADKVAIEQLYGSREMRDDHGVFLRGA